MKLAVAVLQLRICIAKAMHVCLALAKQIDAVAVLQLLRV